MLTVYISGADSAPARAVLLVVQAAQNLNLIVTILLSHRPPSFSAKSDRCTFPLQELSFAVVACGKRAARGACARRLMAAGASTSSMRLA